MKTASSSSTWLGRGEDKEGQGRQGRRKGRRKVDARGRQGRERAKGEAREWPTCSLDATLDVHTSIANEGPLLQRKRSVTEPSMVL